MTMMIPEEFYKASLDVTGDAADAFRAAMECEPAVSVRLNRRKLDSPDALGYGPLERVAWCRDGYYLPDRPKFTLNPLLHAGAFYVQDASSMIHQTLVETLVERGLLHDRPLVLDLCAAPGGKTTAMINALPDGAFVVANEVMPQRVKILAENLQKWGYPDILVTGSRSSDFAALGAMFDLIAVDAPCSGEGMMRKDEEARAQWSPRLVEQCASLQREILADAVEALRPGGVLIYSTCTFNRRENEDNVRWLVDEFGLEPLDHGLPEGSGPAPQVEGPVPALRFMPHLTRGEGLFVAMLRKPGDVPAAPRAKARDTLRRKLRVVLDGIQRSTMKGKTELPASTLCLATDYDHSLFPEVELALDTALRYLRHEAITLPPEAPRGYVVVTYKGHPLGLVKNIGNRANNLYPAHWRIRNL